MTRSSIIGTIEGTDITCVFYYNQDLDVDSLIATFTHSLYSTITVNGLVQTYETVNDSSNPVTYRVTAQDNTYQDYVITVIIESSPMTVEDSGFVSASDIGDTAILTLSESGPDITMIYAQNQASVTFPTKVDDSESETLTTRFWATETEMTNAQAATILQCALDYRRLTITANKPYYGEQLLIELDHTEC